jgi:DNA transformation protein
MRTSSFIEYATELVGVLGPVRGRSMMGGYTIFYGDLSIALIAHDRLYLKVDAETKDRFAAAGGEPFTYDHRGKTVAMSYWTPPDEALESPEAMRPWAEAAVEAAARSKKPRKAGAKKAAPARARQTPGSAAPARAKGATARKPARTRTGAAK